MRGRYNRSYKNPSALSVETISRVKDLLDHGYKNSEIVKATGVSRNTVSRIKTGKHHSEDD